MQQKDMTGALFVNDRKASDKQPDRTGRALIDGKEYYVSGWINKDRNGAPYLKLAFTARDDAQQYPRDQQSVSSRPKQPAPFGDEQHFTDDDVPF